MRLRCKRSSAGVAKTGGRGTFTALAGAPAIETSRSRECADLARSVGDYIQWPPR